MAAVNYEAVGTWATVVAVVIALFGALFGPPVHEWYRRKRRQPEIHIIHQDYPGITLGPNPATIDIEIKNAEDRDRAENVEAFITVKSDELFGYITGYPEEVTVLVEKGILLLHGQQVSSINPGFGRSVQLATVKSPQELVKRAECGHWNAAFTGLGRNPEYRAPLGFDVRYKLEVVVTGSNFNAAYFHGQACIHEVASLRDDQEEVAFDWTEEFTSGRSTEAGFRPCREPDHHS